MFCSSFLFVAVHLLAPSRVVGIQDGLQRLDAVCQSVHGLEHMFYGFPVLLVQAARCGREREVWTAQPGRRGEVYARPFDVPADGVPSGLGAVEILRVDDLGPRTPWMAPEALELGGAQRAVARRSAAEALLMLGALGAAGQPVEPLYVEGPPIHGVAES